LHKFSKPKIIGSNKFDYAIVDGRQRLETIWSFIKGELLLSSEFEYFDDLSIEARGMSYQDLAKEYPDLKTDFDSFSLNVITIETDDVELIEEMFSRLNEAVPLSAPEKRNAKSGPLPKAIQDLAAHPFFNEILPFDNKRYQHFDVALKFLLSEERGAVVDTKKAYLDKFVESKASEAKSKKLPSLKNAIETLDLMCKIFSPRDPLLRPIGMVMLYFHLFRVGKMELWDKKITRAKLLMFEKKRLDNRASAEKAVETADYDLLEFDRYTQSPNDAYAVKLRLSILLREAFAVIKVIEDL